MILTKKMIPVSVLAFLVVPVFFTQAAPKAAPKIGTVDMQKALQTVNAGKKARTRLEKDFNKKREELKKEEASIKKMQETFQKQSLAMSDQARLKKQQALQERVLKFQEKLTRSQMEIQKREQSLTGPILKKLRGVISKLAKDKGYTVVLEKNENSVLYSLEKDDLTKKVIETYNKENKS